MSMFLDWPRVKYRGKEYMVDPILLIDPKDHRSVVGANGEAGQPAGCGEAGMKRFEVIALMTAALVGNGERDSTTVSFAMDRAEEIYEKCRERQEERQGAEKQA